MQLSLWCLLLLFTSLAFTYDHLILPDELTEVCWGNGKTWIEQSALVNF